MEPNDLLALLGVGVLLALAADLIATTLSGGSPGGWLTRRLGRGLWRTARSVMTGHVQLQHAARDRDAPVAGG